jgi:recombination protein RecA
MALSFLKDFKRTIKKMENIITDFSPPKFWISTGNLALNKTISGSFTKGIPQGRITCLAGQSGSGKSFILSNIVKHAQEEGAFVFIIDSEHALDIGYLKKIGVNVDEDKFQYAGVTTFSDVVSVVSEFIQMYEKAYGRDNPDSPKVVIALDSLDMLITDTENEHFQKGEQKGDMGQKARQSKQLLRTIVSRIKRNPMTFILTHQVYPNQDLMNGQGLWIINNAIRYSASQILLIVPAKLKEDGEIVGVRMKVETYKSRFAQIGTKVELEVPYASGMNPYSGFISMMGDEGIVSSAGAWKTLLMPDQPPKKFQMKDVNKELVALMLTHPKIVQAEHNILELMADEENFTEKAEGLDISDE